MTNPPVGSVTPEGIKVIEGVFLAWVYTTVTKLDEIMGSEAATSPKVLAARYRSDLTRASGRPISADDIVTYIKAIRADEDNSFPTLANLLVSSQAASDITTYGPPDSTGAPTIIPMSGWSGGGHPNLIELLSVLA